MSQPPNSISVGSAVLAQIARVPNTKADTHTDTHTDHTTCDICSNKPHLCNECRRRGLKMYLEMELEREILE